MTRRQFIDLIREICGEENISLCTYSGDWVLRMQLRSTHSHIYGYNFDLNGAASQQICSDKNATSLVLKSSGIPCIQHEVFMNPSNALVYDYIATSGSLRGILDYAEKYSNSVVLKPLKGTGGNHVYKTACGKEVEAAVLKIWETDYGVVASPFVEIADEIRVIVLHGTVRLLYRKKRQVVVADGMHSTKELLAERIKEMANPSFVARRLGDMKPKEANEILPAGAVIPVEWRHNLGLGASAEILLSDVEASNLAVEAATALNMKFCSVDVIRTLDGSVSVLEVNSGVMMDSFLSSSTDNRATAKAIYTDAILSSLGV